MKIDFLDLRVKEEERRRTYLDAINRVLKHGRIINGPEVLELERQMARICRRSYAVGVNSGTDALYMALRALDVGPGDEVILPALSWIATANAVLFAGATPVFADILPDLTIDPDSVSQLLSERTKALMPVHFTGKMCDMTALGEISRRHNLHIVEDAAQAFKASYDGRPAGSFGTAGCFSMNPMKAFGALGEAGMIVLDDGDIYERLLRLRYNGTVKREVCLEPGLNGRLDTVQAAVLLEKLNEIDGIIAKRREIVGWYHELLLDCRIELPAEKANQRDVYYTFILKCAKRDELRDYLATHGIETKIQHPILMPDQPAYKGKYRASCARAAKLVEHIVCIPAHEHLTRKEVEYVAGHIRRIITSGTGPVAVDSPALENDNQDIAYHRDDCRLCAGRSMQKVLQLASTPLADAYIPESRLHYPQARYPLDLYLCENCGFTQLSDVVIPQAIYYDYLYETKSSLGLVDHFKSYARDVVRQIKPRPGALVIDVGSNDGTLLRFFSEMGCRVLGIDPAREIARRATASGIETLPKLFTGGLARDIRAQYGAAQIITINNLYANVDELVDMTDGIRHILADDGVFVFESFYLADLMRNMVFDFIYHEHLSYFSVRPLKTFFEQQGMELVDVQQVSTKGGSLRYTVQKKGGPRMVSPVIADFIRREIELGLDRPDVYQSYAGQIEAVRGEVQEMVSNIIARGGVVAAYGASATSTTFLYHFGLEDKVTFIVDDNPLRQNLYSPGAHVPVVSSRAMYEKRPDCVLVLAWRYFEPIRQQHSEYLKQGGQFLVPLPEPKLYTCDENPAELRPAV